MLCSMQRFMSLLLDVWREAGQHVGISEFAQRVAPLLSRHLPAQLVLVHRVDLRNSVLRAVAAATAAGERPEHLAAAQCTPQQLEDLLSWGARQGAVSPGRRPNGHLERWTAGSGSSWRAVLCPEASDCEVLAGALRTGEQLTGVLVLPAQAGCSFSDLHLELVSELLNPFSTALENDRVFREMATLREAAEADRQALLARLGREKLGDTIVGAEAGLRPVMERLAQVARADVPVLLFGETGSGKELIARAVHARSDRREGPFHRVNCGAIPTELVDSELFGHERGSFTGATATRKGWFERADGGTLFLDEIGELPLSAQVRLLRVVQDGTFERVGGQRQLQVDVRIVAATHRNLQRMVGEGRFREDLWYRLAVFPIHIPPLRARPEDLPALAAHFAQRAARRFGLSPMMPTRTDLDLLSRYAWPGNVRELAAVIDRAAILGDGRCLKIADALGPVPALSHGPTSPDHQVATERPAWRAPDGVAPSLLSLDEAIRRHIEAALRATQGRVEGPRGAARLLGVNPHTLRGRMRKLGIRWQRFRLGP
jgi:hydrogenase-4 transcriptional activator